MVIVTSLNQKTALFRVNKYYKGLLGGMEEISIPIVDVNARIQIRS